MDEITAAFELIADYEAERKQEQEKGSFHWDNLRADFNKRTGPPAVRRAYGLVAAEILKKIAGDLPDAEALAVYPDAITCIGNARTRERADGNVSLRHHPVNMHGMISYDLWCAAHARMKRLMGDRQP